MEWKTHFAGGVLSGVGFALLCEQKVAGLAPMTVPELMPCVALAAVGGLMPDIDLKTSKIGQKTGLISKIISFMFGHRTLFHSPILYIIALFALKHYFPNETAYIWAFLFGVASHLLLDMLNKKGIPLFYPSSKHYHIAHFKTGGGVDHALTFILSIGAILLAGTLSCLKIF